MTDHSDLQRIALDYQRRTLHATRAIAIYFVRSGVAALCGLLVAAAGYGIGLLTGQGGAGVALIVVAAAGLAIAQFVIVFQASEELHKSEPGQPPLDWEP